MQSDLARIAFVTRRFEDLQGLHMAVFGGALVAWSVASTLAGADLGNPFIFLVFAQTCATALFQPLRRYYERTFGRTSGRATSWRSGTPRRRAEGSGLFILLMGFSADMMKGLFYPGGFSLAAIALAIYSLRIVIRDWPNRPYYLIGVIAGIASIAVSASVPITPFVDYRMDPVVAHNYLLVLALAGLGLLGVGLLDHRLLVDSMSGRHSGAPKTLPPDSLLTHIRLLVSATLLVGMLIYVNVWGWPRYAIAVYMVLNALLMGTMVISSIWELRGTLATRAAEFEELARAREARLLAQVAAMKGVPSPREIEAPPQINAIAQSDLLGHVALPFSMACGALIDVALQGTGAPSLLALAFAASHLRIATRDWPSRGYYLLGVAAGIMSAVHFMLIDQRHTLDWAVTFILLVSGAMVIEAFLDLRLARRSTFQTEHHADAI